ncbi:MAG: hypothetical protein ACJ74E_07815 [Actinomycetes bacterium]
MPTAPTTSRRPRRARPHSTIGRAALAGLAALAVTGLSACDKPAPGATVFSGTHSANREAICWSADANESFTASDCSISLESTQDFNDRLLEKVAIIPTAPGDTVGISVDSAVAENGWQVTINGRQLSRDPLTDKYFKFTMPPQPLQRGDAQLVIQALTDDGSGVRGSWIFGLSDSNSE